MGVVGDYLETVESPQKEALQKVKAVIESAAPEAKEVITYGMPGYKYNGKYLISFAAFKDHMSIFPGAEAIEIYKDKLAEFKISKGTVQFTVENQIPESLLRDIVVAGMDRINS